MIFRRWGNDRMTRILCLDDDLDTLNLLSQILKRAGYEVLTTTGNYEALDIMHHQSIDLLTQDYMRPDLDGLEFLKIMKSDAALRDIPVLGISARPCDSLAEVMKMAGLDFEHDLAGCVTKPFDPFEILEAVSTALTKHGKEIPPQAAQLRDRHPGQQSVEADCI